MNEPVRIGVVGCGVIANTYVPRMQRFPDIDVVAVSDLVTERATRVAEKFGVPRVMEVAELLSSDEIDLVLNLTVPVAHAEVGARVLEAGKSLYNEKPLATVREDGAALLKAASDKGLRVGCAPDTFLGAGIQTCRKLVDDGDIGIPVAAVAFTMSRGPESWHPNPDFFYQKGGGPMFDVGPYPLTALITLLGPVRRVTGSTRITWAERVITAEGRHGETIGVEVPTHIAGVLDFESGAVATLITSFDVWGSSVPSIEVYGSEGSLKVPDPNVFGGPVSILRAGTKQWEEVAHTHPYTGYGDRGVGVADMAHAMRTGRPHRASGELAYHVLDIMHALHEASEREEHVHVQSTCERPAALPPGLPVDVFDD